MSAARGPEQAAVDALRDEILNPATSPLALAVDVPFKAAMLGLEWPEVRRLFDERERRLARGDALRRPRTRPPARRGVGGARLECAFRGRRRNRRSSRRAANRLAVSSQSRRGRFY